MLIRYVTLWPWIPWSLTRWPWKFVIHQASCDQSLYKIWAKSNNPWLSYWLFSTFTPCNFREWGTFTERFSGVRGPNFTKLGENIQHRAIMTTQEVIIVWQFGYLAAFSNAGGSKLNDIENDTKFRTFFNYLWKVGEGWAGSLYQMLKLFLRPNLRNTFDGHPLCGCWARWIDKKRKVRG